MGRHPNYMNHTTRKRWKFVGNVSAPGQVRKLFAGHPAGDVFNLSHYRVFGHDLYLARTEFNSWIGATICPIIEEDSWIGLNQHTCFSIEMVFRAIERQHAVLLRSI